jgi:hypothetical protein
MKKKFLGSVSVVRWIVAVNSVHIQGVPIVVRAKFSLIIENQEPSRVLTARRPDFSVYLTTLFHLPGLSNIKIKTVL